MRAAYCCSSLHVRLLVFKSAVAAAVAGKSGDVALCSAPPNDGCKVVTWGGGER